MNQVNGDTKCNIQFMKTLMTHDTVDIRTIWFHGIVVNEYNYKNTISTRIT